MAREQLTRQQREDLVVETKYNRGSSNNNKSSASYLSQPNVKEFNKELQKKIFKGGRPSAFDKYDDFEKEVLDYFNLCTDKQVVPTITSLALWLGCEKNTIYEHSVNPNSRYSTILKRCITYCHSLMQNGVVDGKINPVAYIFISKNDYSMSDSKEIKLSADTQATNVNNEATMEAIQKQLEEENIPNADYEEVSSDY